MSPKSAKRANAKPVEAPEPRDPNELVIAVPKGRVLEQLVNLLGHGAHQLTVTTKSGFLDDFFDLGSNNNDFFGLLGHLFLPVARYFGKRRRLPAGTPGI